MTIDVIPPGVCPVHTVFRELCGCREAPSVQDPSSTAAAGDTSRAVMPTPDLPSSEPGFDHDGKCTICRLSERLCRCPEELDAWDRGK